MLSEDEKAIQFYKRFIETEEQELKWMYKEDEEYYRDSIEQKELLIKGWRNISNLITKLQKEIERQKEKRENQKVELAILNEKQKEMNKLKNTVSSYHGMFKKQEKQIKELQKENEEKDKQIEQYLNKRIKDIEKCYNEMLTDIGGIKIINITGLSKKEKEEVINKRNCLLVQKHCYQEILEKLAKEKGA